MTFYSNAFFVSTAYILCLFIKPLFVALEFPSSELIEQVIEPVTPDQYWMGSITFLPWYLFFLFAMLPVWRSSTKNINLIVKKDKLTVFSVYFLTIIVVLSLVSLCLFLIKFPELLSTFKKNSIASTDLQNYDSGGVWRLLISFSLIASIFTLYNIGNGYKRGGNIVLFLLAAGINLSYSIISDQRALVLNSSLIWLATYHLYVRRIKPRFIFIVCFIFIFFGLAQTLYRVSGSVEESVDAYNLVVVNLIGRNGIEHSKTIYIIASVPERLDFQLGRSYIDALLLLMPRVLYPDKVTVNLDTTIGRIIFGSDQFGAGAVPPGLIAELYLNFHVFGLFFGIFLFGRLTGYFDHHFDKGNSSVLFQFFYLLVLVSFGAGILGSGLASSITQLIMTGAVLFISYLICRTNYFMTGRVGRRSDPRS